jgi:hypothetical protein
MRIKTSLLPWDWGVVLDQQLCMQVGSQQTRTCMIYIDVKASSSLLQNQ